MSHVNIPLMAEARSKRSYRGVQPEERKAQRRAQLLEAATRVFGENGVKGATVKQICGEAGLTERYFYESFKNQQALFAAVYEAGVDRIRSAILTALAEAPDDSAALTQAAMTAFYSTLRDDPRLARIILVEVFGSTYQLEELYQRGVGDFADLTRDIIEAQGLIDPDSGLDAGLLSTAFVGATIHLALRWYLNGYPQSVQTMVEHGLLLLRALPEVELNR